MNEQLARGNRKLLGRFLVNLLSYADKPFDNQPVDLANGDLCHTRGASQDREYAKEAELIEIVRDARAHGRKSLIYLTFTGKRDTSPRIQKLSDFLWNQQRHTLLKGRGTQAPRAMD